MEKQLAKIVNRGMVGEPENVVFQIIESLKIFEFSQVKYVNESDVVRDVTLVDDRLDQPEIQHILHNMGHDVHITFDENDSVTLYF